MKRLRFFVTGKPAGFSRSSAAVGARTGRGYMPEAQKTWRTAVAWAYLAAAARQPCIPTDGAHSGRIGLAIEAWGTSGDWDNIGKEISDALQGLAYRNDGQVVNGRVRFPDRTLHPTGAVKASKEPEPGAYILVIFFDL